VQPTVKTDTLTSTPQGVQQTKPMATYTQLLYQIVFSTKNREITLLKPNREKLYHYIWGLLKNKKCTLYRINGTNDHLHIVTHIHPTISVSSIVKVSTSQWIKSDRIFPAFDSWQEGYGAFTYVIKEKEALVNYVINQDKHHKTKSFKEEFNELLNEHEIEFDERYLL